MRTALLILSLCIGLANASARPLAHRADSLSNRLATQVYLYPQEKIYVHTDKPYYMAGDTIWLRAHVADASTHAPAALSKYVYVEFQSAEKPASGEQPPAPQRIRIREHGGVYAGYLPLPMTAKGGDYTLTAYTAFMRNAGPDYFFRLPVYVSAYGSRYERQSPMRSARQDFDVAFFPEGGYRRTAMPGSNFTRATTVRITRYSSKGSRPGTITRSSI